MRIFVTGATGFIGSATLNAFLQVAIIVALGNLVYGVQWPENPLLLAAFTALGVICFASLGVAFSHVIPNEDAAPAFTNAVFLPLIFISGVFYSADDLPKALLAIAVVGAFTALGTAISGKITSLGTTISK